MDPKAPKRRHEITIKIGANTWDDFLAALHEIEFLSSSEHDDSYPWHSSLCAGGSYSFLIEGQHHPEQTAENYTRQVNEFVAARKARQAAAGETEGTSDES